MSTPRWTVDECPDANGHLTIRPHDGTPNGDTNAAPIATVYILDDADRWMANVIAAAPALRAALERIVLHYDRSQSTSNPRPIGPGTAYAEARAALALARGD